GPNAEACSDERHGAGARSDPPAASHEEGSTYMIMTQALGWALVDSLWQDALAAAGLAALLALVPVRAARIRYAFATLTLALMLALPLATAVRLSGTSPQISDVVTATSPVTPTAPVADRIRAALEPALPWAVLVWFGGVVALSLRLASGWLVTRQLGRVGTSSVPDACREAVARLAALLRRSRRGRVRRRTLVRNGAARHGAAPRRDAGLRPGGGWARRLPHGSDPPAGGAGADGDLPPLDGGRDRRDSRARRRRPLGDWDGGHGRPRRHANGDARFPDRPRRGVG